MTTTSYPIDQIAHPPDHVLEDVKKNQKKKEKKQKERLAERFARWLFETFGSFRHLMAFLIILALTYISIRFNYELGKLNSVDEISRELLPKGYALLDMAGLFLSGYIGIKTSSKLRRIIAWGWFSVLLCLSLWAAASFTLSVDSRLENSELTTQIESKKSEIKTQQGVVATWQKKFEGTTRYTQAYGQKLKEQQGTLAGLKAELATLEGMNTAPALAIYDRVAPHLGIKTESLVTIVKLIWSAAMTLSPLILMLLVAAEIRATKLAKESEKASEANESPTPTDPHLPPTGGDGERGRKGFKGRLNRFTKSFKQQSPYHSPAGATASNEGVKPEGKKPPLDLTQGAANDLTPSPSNGLTHPANDDTLPVPTGNPNLTQTDKAEKANLTHLGKAKTPKSGTSKPKGVSLKKKSKGRIRPRNHDSADTGTKGGKANRYEEIREKVLAGKVRPSKPGIKKAAQCNQITAEKYLTEMAKEGLIERLENGQYKLVKTPSLAKKTANTRG